jgi:hypothetical protein
MSAKYTINKRFVNINQQLLQIYLEIQIRRFIEPDSTDLKFHFFGSLG